MILSTKDLGKLHNRNTPKWLFDIPADFTRGKDETDRQDVLQQGFTGLFQLRHGLGRTIASVPPQENPNLLWPPHDKPYSVGKMLLLGTFCLHYFHRTFVYSLLSRGQPYPLNVMMGAIIVTSANGFLQGYYLLHCAQLDEWKTGCCFKIGLLLFYTGMVINTHSDYMLRNLRKKGEVIYKVPKGGLFEYVSAPNYFGEIIEWFGYAMATWGLPSLSFFVFTTCFIGPRAFYHHRFYKGKFQDYPKSRKALLPFLL
ncbi:3-oxo-5-alpha-steroid 4-dehydrogenase 2b isoform X2 [Vanacampus margaritifer]